MVSQNSYYHHLIDDTSSKLIELCTFVFILASTCSTCHMAYIFTFYIFVPSLNNKTFLFSLHILLSIHLYRSLNSYVSVLPRACTWVYKQANYSQKRIVTSAPASPTAPPLQSSLHHRLLPWSWLC